MQQLEALTREAVALASPAARVIPIEKALTPQEAEVSRQMQICNACRYCEGFCAVFPAMTRRLDFFKNDVHFLANLCHNCGACLHACQYAPPHEFAVNVPKAMAQVRGQTYGDYAWPPALGALYRRNGLVLGVALALGLALFVALAAASQGGLWRRPGTGGFYEVLPHGAMVAMFGPVFLFAVLALAMGVRQFWRDQQPGAISAPAAGEATHDALRLKYLDGGHGDGCNNEDDRFTLSRRRAHHLTFYGFMLCFAATVTGTVYHYAFGWVAPYDFSSLPKLLGTVGGVSLLAGTISLLHLNLRRHPEQGDRAQRPMDLAFIGLLLLAAVTGLVLMLVRGTAAVPLTLALHLGAVMALFLTLPYGKFAHAVYRGAALLKWSVEKRQPSRLQLGND
jgi:citrate/tricarballylate utilization protein